MHRYLIEGRKVHLRLYVVLRDVDPLRVFLFKDGLALFASEVYSVGNSLTYSSKVSAVVGLIEAVACSPQVVLNGCCGAGVD